MFALTLISRHRNADALHRVILSSCSASYCLACSQLFLHFACALAIRLYLPMAALYQFMYIQISFSSVQTDARAYYIKIKKTLKTLEIVELWWANERFSSQRQGTYQIGLVCILGHIAQSPCHRSLSTSNTENWVVTLCADTEFTVITGRGLGSINNVPKIKNAVTQYLNARGIIWRYLENNNGTVKFRVVHHKSLGQFDLKAFLFGLKGWVLSTKGAYHFIILIWI